MQNVLILGGTGFVGRHVCEHLARQGLHATVPTRHLAHAKAIQMLPGVTVVAANVHDGAALQALLPGHDAVVNLVAVLHGNQARMAHVHVDLPRTLAQAMQATGVRRLVHVSALGANAAGPSRYQRTKAQGEAVLQEAGLALTVLRPSVIFGAEDHFLNLFAKLQAVVPLVPLAGADTRFQPVWVGDVARAVVHCLQHPRTSGQTIECVGPQVLTLADLVRLAGRLAGHRRPVLGLPRALGYLQALVMECLPGEPLMSRDNLRSMAVDNVATGQYPSLKELGWTPADIESTAMQYLRP